MVADIEDQSSDCGGEGENDGINGKDVSGVEAGAAAEVVLIVERNDAIRAQGNQGDHEPDPEGSDDGFALRAGVGIAHEAGAEKAVVDCCAGGGIVGGGVQAALAEAGGVDLLTLVEWVAAPDRVIDDGEEAEAEDAEDGDGEGSGPIAAEGAAQGVDEEADAADDGDADAEDDVDLLEQRIGFGWQSAAGRQRATIYLARIVEDDIDKDEAVEQNQGSCEDVAEHGVRHLKIADE